MSKATADAICQPQTQDGEHYGKPVPLIYDMPIAMLNGVLLGTNKDTFKLLPDGSAERIDKLP